MVLCGGLVRMMGGHHVTDFSYQVFLLVIIFVRIITGRVREIRIKPAVCEHRLAGNQYNQCVNTG